MKYIKIIGRADDFDDMAETYLARYEIQLEYAPRELAGTKGLCAFSGESPYAAPLHAIEKLAENLNLSISAAIQLPKADALAIAEKVAAYGVSLDAAVLEKEAQIAAYSQFADRFKPFARLDCRFEDLATVRFMQVRFGKMPYNNYKQFQTFLHGYHEMLFVAGERDDSTIYGICFLPQSAVQQADEVLSAFHFEPVDLLWAPDGKPLRGTMAQVYTQVLAGLAARQAELRVLYNGSLKQCSVSPFELSAAYEKIKALQFYHDARQYAAKTPKGVFILVGWMREGDAKKLAAETANEARMIFTAENESETQTSRPPTKLKNPHLARPFETLIRMYGLPAYNEMDPTIFVALTYTILFGIMFGDVGQGSVLALLGFLAYKLKGFWLGAVIGMVGLSAVFFGFMFGSVFGMEHILRGLWMRPTESIHIILMISVILGAVLLLTAMFINMANAFRQQDMCKFFLSPNGLAGLVFYCALTYLVVMALSGSTAYRAPVMIAAVLSLLLLAVRMPAARLLADEAEIIHGSIALFLFETVIELFEVVLSYFTNTLSFVRVGAFALAHAGIMGVVILLSETSPGHFNPIGLILGNVLVIGLEGLVVGIQALRLEFYEMFSRFYAGNGHAFVPYSTKRV